jgi:hypothetical protein
MPDLERALLWGETWARVSYAPRLIAESWRAILRQHDIPSALKTPWGWITTTNIIELEAGTYYGDVLLYVPEPSLEMARALLLEEGEEATAQTP